MCNAWKHVLGRRKNICAGPQHLIVLTGSFHKSLSLSEKIKIGAIVGEDIRYYMLEYKMFMFE